MKIFIVFFIMAVGCHPNVNKSKDSSMKNRDSSDWIIDGEKYPVIAEASDNLWIDLQVYSYSKDSIVVHSGFNNLSNDTFMLYKPLVPYNDNTEYLFSVLTDNELQPVDFLGTRTNENYVKIGLQSTIYVVPNLQEKNMISLAPNSKLEFNYNIANKYDFDKFLKQGITKFKLVYAIFFPFIKGEKQVIQRDSSDNKMKPVYYRITMRESRDPDSMRVDFKIPTDK